MEDNVHVLAYQDIPEMGPSVKTSMNVIQTEEAVMQMLLVITSLEHTHVHANQDILEMELTAVTSTNVILTMVDVTLTRIVRI